LAYRHSLRVSELVALKREQIDMERKLVHVTRRKRGTPSVHPILGDEARLLRPLLREHQSPFVFISERGGPMGTRNARTIIAKLGQFAELGFPTHPHSLRHACGYFLANSGEDIRSVQTWLGHSNLQHTSRYCALTATPFATFRRRGRT
jgi:type 1 fimbriae regulatory protein FimB/type 1 fimbriae regulatory protein FimE